MSQLRNTEVIDGERIAVWDNGGASVDRYTVVYANEIERGFGNNTEYGGLGLSEDPFGPYGFGMHVNGVVPGRHLGKRIKFADLPERARECVLQDIHFDEYFGQYA